MYASLESMRAQSFVAVAYLLFAVSMCGQQVHDQLAGNTVLIIRHAEKPEAGTGLNRQGERRAELYASYFEPFSQGDLRFNVDALYAGSDSENSNRPRLTLEPLSHASGIALHREVGTKEPEKLVTELRTEPHGTHPLIAWRHGQIPALLQAFGADAKTLLPDGRWPDDVYDWVIALRFDETGMLQRQERLQEHLIVSEQ